ncbi:MAG: VCBS repeat-containing protein [Saonia sp.]
MAVFMLLTGCAEQDPSTDGKRFRLLGSESSGIEFVNQLTESDSLNYFTYQYMYMGGGVAVGDLNNDGLSDVFFTGNMVANKLYLNKGNLKFEDVSVAAGVKGDSRWYTGVSFVDIDADGYLDIYLSVSGKSGDKRNQLFLNNGDLTFTEKASEFGINDNGQSIQSSFFDYDHDGDLDLFVINYPITDFKTPNTIYRMMMNDASEEKSDRFYRNDGNGHFTDVTKEAGLLNFGLSVSSSIGDFNQDGWDDIYVSNDFSTPDYLYINNGDGTFTDRLKETTKQTSFYGMGTDAEDFNNDGLLDLFQVDMASEDNRRSKANMASMDIGLFWSTVNNGFHYQYMYNSFQLNQGLNEDGLPVFSNINWMSGVAATDWSWAPLAADFDNDGWKDLFITNGTRREINNKDYFKRLEKNKTKAEVGSLVEQVENMPSEKIDNYIFRNKDGSGFEKTNVEWGLSFEGFSNGTAYGDLDNDGDLDLVINNIDDKSVIFENRTSQLGEAHYLKVVLKTNEPNLHGIGAKVSVVIGKNRQYLHLNPSKGFQSYVEPVLHFGLGEKDAIDSLIVDWTDGTREVMLGLASNQTIAFKKGKHGLSKRNETVCPPMFSSANKLLDSEFWHSENNYNDFVDQILLPHKLSNLGPALATGDVNGDLLEDIYVGNGAGFSGALYLQQPDGRFSMANGPWEKDAAYEDIGAVFFDANNDGHRDLYVVSGGNDFRKDEMYQDRLYLNRDGNFVKSNGFIPKITGSGSRVIPRDMDNDGDIDLFVGGRLSPQNYPHPGRSYLLVNQTAQGRFMFEDQTEELAPGLSKIGMVTDALWIDFDENGTTDLVVVGEWMPLTIYSQENGQFKNATALLGFENTTGWWFSIDSGDFDRDGDADIIVGNLGTNYKYQASAAETFDIFANDFDENGTTDLVLGYHDSGVQYPVRGRQCSSQQIPAIQLKFKDYGSFANATIKDIYGKENLEASLHYEVASFASIYMENQGKGKFRQTELPFMAQISPVNEMVLEDFNDDGDLDVLLGGNLYASEVETPRNDAGIGIILLGDGQGAFDPLPYTSSGINMSYDVKALGRIGDAEKTRIIVANNQGPLQFFTTAKATKSKLHADGIDYRKQIPLHQEADTGISGLKSKRPE